MKAFLMFRDQDFEPQRKLPPNEPELTQDLGLNILFEAMALGDKFLFEVARNAVLFSSSDLDTIRYRQNILKDCLKNASVVRAIYDLSVEAIAKEKKSYFGYLSKYPDMVLRRSIEVLQMFVGMLKRLRSLAEEHADAFESEGFARFFAMIKRELDADYFAVIEGHLAELRFRNGVLISAELGKGNKGSDYVLRKPQEKDKSWIKWIFAQKTPVYSYRLHPRDEAGARALSELKDRGINLVANALAQSTDHILSFFGMLRIELGFYIGCLNLQGQLAQKGEPIAFPQPVACGERRHAFAGLYDICLSLSLPHRAVGNEADLDDRDLVVITGANQGGKSTFLRSVGLAQLMMQCGMFVPAEAFRANVCEGLFTHFKREEDPTMTSGKLDEELRRMSQIAGYLQPNFMLLFNESFAATNEREGSEIARQITTALLEKRIKIFFVTHLYEFAHGFYEKAIERAAFLRAERQADRTRTFELIEGSPLQTSYGEDLYDRIFATEVPDDRPEEKVIAS